MLGNPKVYQREEERKFASLLRDKSYEAENTEKGCLLACLCAHGQLLFHTNQDDLTSAGPVHSGLGLPPSTNNQENAQYMPQANLIEASPQLRVHIPRYL